MPKSAAEFSAIRQKIAQGGITMILLRLSIRLLGLVSTMILFRILVPNDFGLVALAATVVGLVDVSTDFGFDTALIRMKDATPRDYDLVWSLSVLRGVLVAGLLLFVAEPASLYLHEPRLEAMIHWLALVPLVDGFRNTGVIDFSRELQFEREFVLRLAQKLVSFVVTLLLAFWLRSYWALVVGVLCGRSSGLLLTYLLHDFRPRFSLSGWRRVSGFSTWIVLNNGISYAGSQVDKLALQRQFDAHLVGLYRVAEEICNLVLELIVPVEHALYAGYSRLSDRQEELRRIMLNSVGVVALVSIPASVGLALVSEPLLSVLLGPNAAGAGAFMAVLVLHGAIRACQAGVAPVFLALGQPELDTRLTAVSVAVRLGVLFYFLPSVGAMAAPWALVAGSVVSFLMVWSMAGALLDLRWWSIIEVLWRPVLAVGVMTLAVPWTEIWMFGADWDPNDWIQLGFRVVVGVFSYLGVVIGAWLLIGRPSGAEATLIAFLRGVLARHSKG